VSRTRPCPHGPIAFALLIVAAIWLWWSERKAAGRKFTTEDLRELRWSIARPQRASALPPASTARTTA